MYSPKIILEILSKNNGKVDNIYKHLYNPEFYKIAYNNIYSKTSQMTPASDGSTVDDMSMERIEKLIQSLRDKTYQPTPLRRVNIPKKSGGTRPISVPSFDDKLVQEVIRMLLEAIYDHTFSDHSHGFRPNRSCHTTLRYVQQKFRAGKWWLSMDIANCFDSIDHHLLMGVLSKRIRELKFLNLILKFLKNGYIDSWKYGKTYSGIPQGNILGPILFNIYMDVFDKFMEEMCLNFNRGEKRIKNPKYASRNAALGYIRTKIRKVNDIKTKNNLRHEYDIIKKERDSIPCYNYVDCNFKRLSYVRYADDFIIGVVGHKIEVEELRNKIIGFLKTRLKLNTQESDINIIHNSEKIRFLGYDISIARSDEKKSVNGVVCLWIPFDVCKNFIIDNRFGKFVCDSKTGKQKLRGFCRPELINNDEIEILRVYNTKIRGLYNYYKMASNVYKLNGFSQVVQDSFFRTLAAKYKTSCAKLYKNKSYSVRKNGKTIVGVTYNNKFYEYFDGPFKVIKIVRYEKNVDVIENTMKYSSRTSLIQRLEAKKCEFCGNEEGPFEVHHVKKLKDLKGKAAWEKLMIARNRKTMVLCVTCHDKLHAGKL